MIFLKFNHLSDWQLAAPKLCQSAQSTTCEQVYALSAFALWLFELCFMISSFHAILLDFLVMFVFCRAQTMLRLLIKLGAGAMRVKLLSNCLRCPLLRRCTWDALQESYIPAKSAMWNQMGVDSGSQSPQSFKLIQNPTFDVHWDTVSSLPILTLYFVLPQYHDQRTTC